MDAAEFGVLVNARIERCRDTLLSKGDEYARGGDRLHNFKSAVSISQFASPEISLMGMLLKHVVSVDDMLDDLGEPKGGMWRKKLREMYAELQQMAFSSGIGTIPIKHMVDEKITDWINYGLLLEGLIEDRRACAQGC